MELTIGQSASVNFMVVQLVKKKKKESKVSCGKLVE